MKKNMGMIDRSIRFLIATAIMLMYFMHYFSGVTAIVLMALAIVFILTSFISFCPLYLPFGIHTNKKSSKE